MSDVEGRNEIFNFMSIHYQISANKCEDGSESERTSREYGEKMPKVNSRDILILSGDMA